MRTVRTVAELRAALREARRAERVDRPRPDDGRAPRRASEPHPRARAPTTTSSSSRSSSTRRSSTRRATSAAYPRDEARDAAAWRPRPAPTCSSRRELAEVYPPGLRDDGARRRPSPSTLEGEHRGVAPLRGRRDRRHASCSTWCGRTSRTSARRTRSRRSSSAASCATSTSRCASRSARPCARPTAWRCRAATSTCSGADRERALALRDALAAAEASLTAGERDAGALARRRLRRDARARRRARVLRARPHRRPSPRRADRRRRPRRRGRPRRLHPPHRQHDPAMPMDSREAELANERTPEHPTAGRRLAPADDAAAARPRRSASASRS